MIDACTPVSRTPVLVAGAGPVGLLTALELARRGVAVRVIDRRSEPLLTSRAVAVHPRTLELYEQLGLLDAMLARGRMIRGFTIFHRGRRLVRLEADYSSMPTRHPFTLAIEQVHTEEVLREELRRLGVAVEWETNLDTFEEQADHVSTTLNGGKGIRRQEAMWLIGCDGGHSTVRNHLGLPLQGTSKQTWLLADAVVDAPDLPNDSIYYVRVDGGTLMAVPLRDGRWRLLDTVDVDASGGDAAVGARFADKLSRGLDRPVVVRAPTWVSVFTAQQRMVPAMRKGRVLLAGDAAHVHSPASGQGLNTGLHEAANLGWKLAAVLDGADDALLDTYSEERVPVGRHLLSSTENATDLVNLHTPAAEVLLPLAMGAVRRIPHVRRRIQRKILSGISGLSLDYSGSSLVGTADGDRPWPGERATRLGTVLPESVHADFLAELADPRWSLLLGAGVRGEEQAFSRARSEWLSVRTVDPDRVDGTDGILADRGGGLTAGLALQPRSWILVRPDGYVAARGRELDAADHGPLDRALARTYMDDLDTAARDASNDGFDDGRRVR